MRWAVPFSFLVLIQSTAVALPKVKPSAVSREDIVYRVLSLLSTFKSQAPLQAQDSAFAMIRKLFVPRSLWKEPWNQELGSLLKELVPDVGGVDHEWYVADKKHRHLFQETTADPFVIERYLKRVKGESYYKEQLGELTLHRGKKSIALDPNGIAIALGNGNRIGIRNDKKSVVSDYAVKVTANGAKDREGWPGGKGWPEVRKRLTEIIEAYSTRYQGKANPRQDNLLAILNQALQEVADYDGTTDPRSRADMARLIERLKRAFEKGPPKLTEAKEPLPTHRDPRKESLDRTFIPLAIAIFRDGSQLEVIRPTSTQNEKIQLVYRIPNQPRDELPIDESDIPPELEPTLLTDQTSQRTIAVSVLAKPTPQKVRLEIENHWYSSDGASHKTLYQVAGR